MARLKPASPDPYRARRWRLTDRIRDGAIETYPKDANVDARANGLPIGFAMARLKRLDVAAGIV